MSASMAPESGERPRLAMRTKLAFGAGSAAEAGVYIAFNTFNMLFYNNVLGLSGALCGLAVSIALVFDAVSDPLVGAISDRFHSSLGRRHPFMYASALPLALLFFAVYAPPSGLGEIGLFLWLCGGTTLLHTAMTLFTVPHLALGAELSPNYRERSTVMAYSAIFQVLGGASAAFLAWSWFGRAAGGTAARHNYVSLGAWVAGLSALAILASAYFTRDQIKRLAKAQDLPALTPRAFVEDMARCLRNRNYRMLLLGLILLGGTLGLRETLETYLVLFFWELPADKIRLFHLMTPPAYAVAFVLAPRLHEWLDKREAIVAAVWGLALAVAIPVLARMAGLFPPNGSPALFQALLAFVVLFFLSLAVLMISVMSALADIADEHELLHGRRQEGILYSARTFFLKITTGAGHLLAGIALDVIGFPAGAEPGDVPDDTIFALGVVAGPVASLPALAATIFYARYRIDKQRHAEVQADLALRRSALSTTHAEAE